MIVAKQLNIPRGTLDGWVRRMPKLKRYIKGGFGSYCRLPGGGRAVANPALDAHLLAFVASNRRQGSTTNVADLIFHGQEFLDAAGDSKHKCSHGFIRGFAFFPVSWRDPNFF